MNQTNYNNVAKKSNKQNDEKNKDVAKKVTVLVAVVVFPLLSVTFTLNVKFSLEFITP